MRRTRATDGRETGAAATPETPDPDRPGGRNHDMLLAAGWPRRNLVVLTVFAPVLVVTGVFGLAFPGAGGPLSDAVPYDLFHIAFGLAGGAVVLSRRPAAAALFNVGFGAIDLYQLGAGLTGAFPARLFALRPGDHAAHLVIGALLVACGSLGLLRASARRVAAGGYSSRQSAGTSERPKL